jgi:hypothetical protein
VTYLQDGEEDFMFTGSGAKDDLQIGQAWKYMNADMKKSKA